MYHDHDHNTRRFITWLWRALVYLMVVFHVTPGTPAARLERVPAHARQVWQRAHDHAETRAHDALTLLDAEETEPGDDALGPPLDAPPAPPGASPGPPRRRVVAPACPRGPPCATAPRHAADHLDPRRLAIASLFERGPPRLRAFARA